MATSQPTLQARAARPKRRAKRVIYVEDDSDGETLPIIPSTRPIRQTRQNTHPIYYDASSSLEDSSDIESDSGSLVPEASTPRPVRSLPRLIAPSPKSSLRQSHKRKAPPTRNGADQISLSSFKRRKTRQSDFIVESKSKEKGNFSNKPRNIPPWQDLEYQIIFKIVKLAAYPLYAPASIALPSIRWLLGMSLLSKSFHAASVAALLHSPPLHPSPRAHSLLRLLSRNQESLSTNFRNKIHCLDIEVKLISKKNAFSLPELLSYTPSLRELKIYHNHDDMMLSTWARPSSKKGQWAYTDVIFQALDENHIVLRKFEWNSRFPTTIDVLETMQKAHSRSCFCELRSLSLVNFNLPDQGTDVELVEFEHLMLEALVKLQGLSQIDFRNSTIVATGLVSQLPVGLQRVSFSNCPGLTSAALREFLSARGRTIKTLDLISNQAMDLGFMPDLAESCPQLQHLKIDLTYTDPSSFHDIEPHYDELLPLGQPTWPSSLVELEIENLRRLRTIDEAENFFASLVDAALELRNLRRLSIKAILKEAGWRDRARMRLKWQTRLQSVFSNRDHSLSGYQGNGAEPEKHRQSVRIAKNFSKSVRISDNDSESALDTEDSTGSQNELEEPLPRQGMCDVVLLRLDDERPTDWKLREDDFLDDEPSGDEDWKE